MTLTFYLLFLYFIYIILTFYFVTNLQFDFFNKPLSKDSFTGWLIGNLVESFSGRASPGNLERSLKWVLFAWYDRFMFTFLGIRAFGAPYSRTKISLYES